MSVNATAGMNPQQREANANTIGVEQSDAVNAKIKRYLDRQKVLAGVRTNWETHWQECFDYIIPRKGDITVTHTPGLKRGQQLFDTTAIMANTLLSGALHSMLTNPATRFFEALMSDPALNEREEVRAWTQDTGDRMFLVLNNSNFQTEVHEVYIDQGAIGTSALYMGDHPEKIVHFSARSMKEIFADENNLGIIDIVHRKFPWKLRQIVQEFGESVLTPSLLRKYKDGVEEPYQIIHVVEPMSDEMYAARGKVHRFNSCYFMEEDQHELKEGGFHEFPYAVPRWTKTTGEVYGRGPGMDMLPDIKMVNVMMETTLKGAQKTVDPPLMVSDDGVIGNVRLTPGGLTIVRPMSDVPIRPLITDARIDFGLQLIEGVRQRIRSGFFVDQLQLQEGTQMTATEVNQRTEEKLRLMGPVLGRQHAEFLRPLFTRVFGLMSRREGALAQPPDAIKGKNLDVRYSSLVARAQRMSEGQNLTRAISVAGPIINARPESLDNLNPDKAVKYIMDIYGVPEKIMSTQREVDQARKARAAAQAKAAQDLQMEKQAQAAGQVGPAAAQMMQAQTAQQKGQGQNT